MGDELFGQVDSFGGDLFGGNEQQQQGGSKRESADDGISENPGRETPKKWKSPKDVRENDKAGDYPNYSSWKTRSGHSIILDDSEGKESLTIQHRSGSAFQMLPNGAIHMVANHGAYNVVFGENRMVVTGAGDITYKGDASIRTYGDVNHTHHGDYNLTVTGDHNITARNQNHTVRGNYEMVAQNYTGKFEGNHAVQAGGAMAMAAHKDVTVASVTGSIFNGAYAGHETHVKKGNITREISQQGDEITTIAQGNKTIDLKQGDVHMMAAGDGFFQFTQGGGGGAAAASTSEGGGPMLMAAGGGGGGSFNLHTAMNTMMHSGMGTHLNAGAMMNMAAGAAMNMNAGAAMALASGAMMHMKATGNLNSDAPMQFHQSGMAMLAELAQMAQQANPLTPKPMSKGGIKTIAEQVPNNRFGNLA